MGRKSQTITYKDIDFLYVWLRKEGLFDKFKRNLKESGVTNKKSLYKYYQVPDAQSLVGAVLNRADCISGAFMWYWTPEHINFWRDVNNEYLKEIKEN